jgi:hypothetical protein
MQPETVSVRAGVLQPPPERALAPVPPSPPRPETRACSLVCYDPFMPPRWLSLPIRSVRFFQDTSTCWGIRPSPRGELRAPGTGQCQGRGIAFGASVTIRSRD